MVRNKQRSCVVRLDDLTHLRLKAVAEIELRDMTAVVELALNNYIRANHPQVISSITSVPEPAAPSGGPTKAAAPKAPKAARKPKAPRK